MDRLSQLRDKAGGASDSSLDTTSPPSEAYVTANLSTSKYYSLSEVDSTFEVSTIKDDVSSIKDVSLAGATTESEGTMTNPDELISNLSPISKKSDILDSYKIDTQIEAANILSGGVAIFDDNDNSYDGDELVIDDNIEVDEKSEVKQSVCSQFKVDDHIQSNVINEEMHIGSKDTEVVLQIDGKNVDAIDIGNGLYLYRKAGQEELAAVQIINDEQQQTSFKFLKVRENAEGNLEVYEEIEIEVPKEVPAKEEKSSDKNTSHVPTTNINKVISESTCSKDIEKNFITTKKELTSSVIEEKIESKETYSPNKSEVNLNGKMMKFSESRKSPVIGSFTPMTYHSTPNKEGIPLTKTMVDQQLHTNRHSDMSNAKKTIEVHTDNCKLKTIETIKSKDIDDSKVNEIRNTENETINVDSRNENLGILKEKDLEIVDKKEDSGALSDTTTKSKSSKQTVMDITDKTVKRDSMEQNNKETLQLDIVTGNAMTEKPEGDLMMIKSNEKMLKTENNQGKKNNMNINIENNREVKQEEVVHIQNKDKKTEILENIEGVAVKKAYHEHSQPKKDEKVVQIDNNEGNKIEKGAARINNPVSEEYNRQVEESHYKGTPVPTQIDSGTETSITTIVSSCEETKTADDDIQSQEKLRNVENIEIQNLNEPIIIDDDISIVEIIVGEDKEKSEKDLISTESVLENMLSVPEDNKKTEDIVIGNEENKLKQPEIIKENALTSLVTDQVVEKVDASSFIHTKPSFLPHKNEPLKKSERYTKVNVLEISTTKSYTNLPKTQLSHISDIKQNEKPVELLQKKEAGIKTPILKQNQKYTVSIHHNLNITANNTSDVQKNDSNLMAISPGKDSVKVMQISEFRPIEMDNSNSVNISITPDLNINRLQSELNFEQEKNIVSKNTNKVPMSTDIKSPSIVQKEQQKDVKMHPKSIPSEKEMGSVNVDIRGSKLQQIKLSFTDKQNISSTSKNVSHNIISKTDTKQKKDIPKVAESKPINNNAAVPFGKWTEANRQEFLNKFKTKTLVTSSSSNQLKNSNDLNRRDVLKKIDSQRQSSNALTKTQESYKLVPKSETAAFSNKVNPISRESSCEGKITKKNETMEIKLKAAPPKNPPKVEATRKIHSESSHTAGLARSEVSQRTGVVQNLIDKTIEGMIHRSTSVSKLQDDTKQDSAKETSISLPVKLQSSYQPIDQATLDEIEMKMNELHGIPFIERPPHELPQVIKTEAKSCPKAEKEKLQVTSKIKIPNLLPFPNKNQQKFGQEKAIEVDSEDEIIEHEPITGDIDVNKKSQEEKTSINQILYPTIDPQIQQHKSTTEVTKKEAIITEKDFDKFARRNSITYENCITVNFDGKEPHNVIQSVVEKDLSPKNYSKKGHEHTDPKIKPHKIPNVRTIAQPIKIQSVNRLVSAQDDVTNRNQSKLQKAYHSVLTAKRQMAAECPITIIEDKPVEVVFMDSVDYVPSQLNVQGQNLSPAKNAVPDSGITVSTCDSLDTDIMDPIDDVKPQDDVKTKTKHQRKQVLAPVEEPELELIEPSDLGIEVSPKKKRRTDEDSRDKNLKYPMRKKLYLLGSNVVQDERVTNPIEIKNTLKDTVNITDNGVPPKNPVSALDSLVKAAELIETQTDNITTSIASNSDSQSSTPVKRGRGRPRKYPLTPDGVVDKNKATAVSPQKKPRLIDAKVSKRDIDTDDSDTDSEIIKENWTMGKINENIVCPICNKLFRTENVVFKHVKHCTGPSPSRSDSDKRSPRRMRISQDCDTKSQNSKSDDMDDDKPLIPRLETSKKPISKDSITNQKPENDIVVEDIPNKEKSKGVEMGKHHESRKLKSIIPKNNLVCEFCGKTFRQLSYLISHKIQHKKLDKTEPKTAAKEDAVVAKSVYSCEVCKKEFRKLHHLVQHRIIHNPNTVLPKSARKASSEQSESRIDRDSIPQKQGEDLSAGFRCEPCDKSFRKLHHLVEHRETHDGINRQKNSTSPTSKEEKLVEKSVNLHHCDVCMKAFKKLQHLNEHKEEHLETSSEKTVTVTDIIHECSICYMVFPNEHSLNKHTVICLRKKRKSKQQKPADESEGGDEVKLEAESPLPEKQTENVESPTILIEDIIEADENQVTAEKVEIIEDISTTEPLNEAKEKSVEPIIEEKELTPKMEQRMPEVKENEPVKILDTPRKKTPAKEKSASATKRLKTNGSIQITEVVKSTVESSDDDEIRYMLNPNFKSEDVTEEKIFMKVKARKRNSLQIERPNSKELVKRRTSLQHPPKIPRLKPKAVVPTAPAKKVTKPVLEAVPSTDSDDSETTKYSFPVTIPVKSTKSIRSRTPKNSERRTQKKSLADKRKSLSAIAKRKSMANSVTAKPKASPLKQIKKRTLNVEHRCDCGQLFSSAALLSRHTSLAHTPPRIRRNRSPPPKPKQTTAPRKLSASTTPSASSKPEKSEAHSSVKPRRAAHRGVPVPEKMKKLMLNNK